jgi:hypothetical protein
MFFRRTKPAPPSFEQELEEARRQGFVVEECPSGYRLTKKGCSAVITREARFAERPALLIDGEVVKLLDRGYQKFLLTPDGRTRPALTAQLRALHDFDAELRHVFRLTSLYNESLGTVSDRYVYDRLAGRT